MRLKNLLLFLCLLACAIVPWSQTTDNMTPDSRAYLFHMVRKSPILEKNIGKALEYLGPIVYFKNDKKDDKKDVKKELTVNYDSIDKILINNPELLIIRKEILAKSPKGVLAEACNKTAIYEICYQIKRFKQGESISSLPLLDSYFTYFFDTIPKEFLRGKTYETLVSREDNPIIYTNISLNERINELSYVGIKSVKDQELILNAQNVAINKAISERAFALFENLGGKSSDFESILLAAGDGSFTTGLLEERDQDDYGAWNKGLPKAIGLFPYQMVTKGEKNNVLVSRRIVEQFMETVGNNKLTQLHFDVWGYNSNKQTTIIIEKGSRQYPLFGSKTTRFLSPDSTFSSGTTFRKVLNDLDNYTFKELKNKLYGKGGYEEQIKQANELRNVILENINQHEGELGELYKVPYKTNKNPNRAMKKKKKQQQNKGPVNIAPTTKSRNKAKRSKQNFLIDNYQMYDEVTGQIEALIEEREPLQEEYDAKQKLIRYYQDKLGSNWCKFTEQNGLYLFDDGSKFDIYTQEFTFQESALKESFTLRLLSIPEDYEGVSSDEIMMHVSKIDALPYYDSDFETVFEDVFKPDAYQFSNAIVDPNDTLFFQKFFNEYKLKKPIIELHLKGLGIGKIIENQVCRDELQSELNSYPGIGSEEQSMSRNSELFKSLRYTKVNVKINRNLEIYILSATDPVKSNLGHPTFDFEDFRTKEGLSKNELLSALRTRSVLNKLKDELTAKATKYLDNSDAKKFIEQLDATVQQSVVYVGDKAIKLPKKWFK